MLGYELLAQIEDSIINLEKNFYYFPFEYDSENFKHMLIHGIKSPILHGEFNKKLKSKLYIPILKNEQCHISKYKLNYELPKFIISPDIHVFKNEEYNDEYKKFLYIEPDDILAIEYNLSYLLNNKEFKKEQLLILKKMILDLKNLKRNLTIIDSNNNTQINQNKALQLL